MVTGSGGMHSMGKVPPSSRNLACLPACPHLDGPWPLKKHRPCSCLAFGCPRTNLPAAYTPSPPTTCHVSPTMSGNFTNSLTAAQQDSSPALEPHLERFSSSGRTWSGGSQQVLSQAAKCRKRAVACLNAGWQARKLGFWRTEVPSHAVHAPSTDGCCSRVEELAVHGNGVKGRGSIRCPHCPQLATQSNGTGCSAQKLILIITSNATFSGFNLDLAHWFKVVLIQIVPGKSPHFLSKSKIIIHF